MEKSIDEIMIKISGRFPIEPQELELGQDVEISLKGGIVKKEIMDNQDGSVNICYVIKPIEVKLKNYDHNTQKNMGT